MSLNLGANDARQQDRRQESERGARSDLGDVVAVGIGVFAWLLHDTVRSLVENLRQTYEASLRSDTVVGALEALARHVRARIP